MGRWANDGTYIDNAVEIKENSGVKAVTVTPNDSTVLSITKGIYLGATGDVSVTMADGSQAIFKNLSGGMIHPLSVTKVKSTGTTATNIIAVY